MRLCCLIDSSKLLEPSPQNSAPNSINLQEFHVKWKLQLTCYTCKYGRVDPEEARTDPCSVLPKNLDVQNSDWWPLPNWQCELLAHENEGQSWPVWAGFLGGGGIRIPPLPPLGIWLSSAEIYLAQIVPEAIWENSFRKNSKGTQESSCYSA